MLCLFLDGLGLFGRNNGCGAGSLNCWLNNAFLSANESSSPIFSHTEGSVLAKYI